MNIRTDEFYSIEKEIMEVLIETIKQSKINKKQNFKERIYQFNELDLLLCITDGSKKFDEDKLNRFTAFVEKKNNGLLTVSKYSKFDPVKANDILNLHNYLQKLSLHLYDVEIRTKYEFLINDEMVVPTEEQQEFVKNYLKSNKIPVNELTYSLALRRLIVGGDIESKYDKDYLINKAKESKQKDQEVKNEDIAGV